MAARRACVASSSIGVSTGPGNTALTRMPDGASSAAAIWVRPRSAHFDEPYAAWLGNGRIAPVLQVLTIAAPSACRSASSAARIPRNGPRQLTRQLLSKPSGVSSASDARCRTPALLTSVVKAPNRSTVRFTAARPLLLRCDVERYGDDLVERRLRVQGRRPADRMRRPEIRPCAVARRSPHPARARRRSPARHDRTSLRLPEVLGRAAPQRLGFRRQRDHPEAQRGPWPFPAGPNRRGCRRPSRRPTRWPGCGPSHRAPSGLVHASAGPYPIEIARSAGPT